MANVFFDNPPILNGQEKQQLQQVYAYLNAMSEKLNQALNNISADQMDPVTQRAVESAGQAAQTIANNNASLKSLIVKTADVIRVEMEEIRTTLNGEIEAISDQYGTYTQNIENQIIQTATGVLNQYSVLENIQSLQQETQSFTQQFNSFIYMGILDNSTTPPTTGIAVGDGLSVDDHTGQISNKMATFTKDRLSFFVGDTEVAYYAGDTFYIDNGQINRTLKMGNHIWQVLADGSIALISSQTGV